MHNFATVLGTPPLTTKEFRCSINPEDGQYVRIVGRKAGFIDSTTTFEVYRDHIRFTTSNLYGQVTTMIAMQSIANTSTGYFKPVLYLVLGILLLPLFGLGIILLITYYFRSRTLMISTQDNSGLMTLIAFKPSVIDGMTIGPKDAEKVVAIINKLVLLSHAK